MTHSYDAPDQWNRNIQHIANATRQRDDDDLPDWLTCSAERFIEHYLPLFESGQLQPNSAQMKEKPE